MTEISGKKIFITGGAGFIGSHLTARFLQEGASEVVVYDNLSTGVKSYLEGLDVTFVEGDILDYDKVKKAMTGCDIVSHHAAELEVFNGIENSVHELQVNIQGTLHILNAAMKNDIEKVAYASSGGVYGQAEIVPEPITHPLMPHWPYGVAKLAGEKYCTQYSLLHGLKTVSFRYAIVFGPHEWYGRVLTLFIKRALEGKDPIIFGNGEQRRDFVFVKDVVEANMLGIKNDDINGQAFNVGGISHVNVKDIAQTVIKVIDPKLKAVFDDPKPGEASKFQPNRKRLPGELLDFILDNSETTRILGYNPTTDLETGLKQEVDWIKNNLSLWDYAPRV